MWLLGCWHELGEAVANLLIVSSLGKLVSGADSASFIWCASISELNELLSGFVSCFA